MKLCSPLLFAVSKYDTFLPNKFVESFLLCDLLKYTITSKNWGKESPGDYSLILWTRYYFLKTIFSVVLIIKIEILLSTHSHDTNKVKR